MATLLSSQSAVAVTLASYAAAAYGSSSGGAAISPAAWPIPEPVSARPGILASVATATAIRALDRLARPLTDVPTASA